MMLFMIHSKQQSEKGYTLLIIAGVAVAVFGALGLAVDLGRMFIAKNELQTWCDAAAIAAALKLDGTTTGMTNATAAATSLGNKWNFDTSTVSSPAVTFATSASGPWVSTANPASGYTYARVSASAPMPLYFVPLIVGTTSQTISATAAAAQVSITSLKRGLAPYTAVSTNTTGPMFGLVPGNSYDLQWPQYNGSRSGCSASNPDRCFNQSPCSGDSAASEAAVVANWGANINGYWGSNANSDIAAEVLDLVQLQPLNIGDNIQPVLSNGNKAAEAGDLDQRANQDNNTSNTYTTYLADSQHNGRRLLAVPIVDPVDPTHTTVIGYGQFLLYMNGAGSNYYTRLNGNDPFCAIYVGPYNIGSTNAGAGAGTSGASTVRLVQ